MTGWSFQDYFTLDTLASEGFLESIFKIQIAFYITNYQITNSSNNNRQKMKTKKTIKS